MFERSRIRRLSRLLVRELAPSGKTLVLAESCTGGLVSAALTEVPGSSAILWGGLVVYANAAKEGLAGVDPALLRKWGAVSSECVGALLDGALSASGADIAGAVSGIAGPGGGSPLKPVGTVWLGAATAEGAREIRCRRFRGNRGAVRRASTLALLCMIRDISRSASSAENP